MLSNERYEASSITGLYVLMKPYRKRCSSVRRAAASNSASHSAGISSLPGIITHNHPALIPPNHHGTASRQFMMKASVGHTAQSPVKVATTYGPTPGGTAHLTIHGRCPRPLQDL